VWFRIYRRPEVCDPLPSVREQLLVINFTLKNGSSQGQNLALAVFHVPSLLDSSYGVHYIFQFVGLEFPSEKTNPVSPITFRFSQVEALWEGRVHENGKYVMAAYEYPGVISFPL